MLLASNSALFLSISSGSCRCFLRDIFGSKCSSPPNKRCARVSGVISLQFKSHRINISYYSAQYAIMGHNTCLNFFFKKNNNKTPKSPSASFSKRPKLNQIKSQILFNEHVSLTNPLEISSRLRLIRRQAQPKLLKMRHHFFPRLSRFTQGA